jgi:lipid-A-disaccharide synthase-like uncharacterized protein
LHSCSFLLDCGFYFLVNTLNKASAIGSFLHSRVAKERLSFRLGGLISQFILSFFIRYCKQNTAPRSVQPARAVGAAYR